MWAAARSLPQRCGDLVEQVLLQVRPSGKTAVTVDEPAAQGRLHRCEHGLRIEDGGADLAHVAHRIARRRLFEIHSVEDALFSDHEISQVGITPEQGFPAGPFEAAVKRAEPASELIGVFRQAAAVQKIAEISPGDIFHQ